VTLDPQIAKEGTMGACLSVTPHSAAALPDLESTLRTGDIVLLLGKQIGACSKLRKGR
jgi:hypothetical protein